MAHAYTEAYRRTVTGGGRYVTRVDVLDPSGQIIATTGLPSQNLPHSVPLLASGGDIHVSASSAVRRSVNGLVLLDPDRALIPTDGKALFSPLSGNELRIWAGYEVNPTATDESRYELFPQGTLGITDAVTDDVPAGTTITITAGDRAQAIAANAFTKPFVIPKGTPFLTAVIAIIVDRYPRSPTLPIFSEPAGFSTGHIVIDVKGDPWSEIQKLALSFGFEVFFDGMGSLIIRAVRDPRDPKAEVQWHYIEGVTSTMLRLQRAQSNRDAPNGQIVTGEGSLPPRGEAWDTNPQSPTYYLGPYGKRPEFFTDPRVFTDAQAQASALGRLYQKLGAAERDTTDVIPNPALVEGDVLAVTRLPALLDDTLLLDEFTLPLRVEGAPVMPLTMRERRVGAFTYIIPNSTSPGSTATLTVSPTSGSGGSSITLTGSGFHPSATVTFTDSASGWTASTTASSGGAFSYATTAPSGAGPHTLTARDNGTPNAVASTVFTVTATTPAAFSLSPTSGAPNTAIHYVGSGFHPNSTVTFSSDLAPSWHISVSASSSGAFDFSASTDPPGTGTHTITATDDGAPPTSAQATFTVSLNPTMRADPNSGYPGSSFVLAGSGFRPGTVAIDYSFGDGSGANFATSVTAAADGSFSASLTVPAGATGTRDQQLTGTESGASPRPAYAAFSLNSSQPFSALIGSPYSAGISTSKPTGQGWVGRPPSNPSGITIWITNMQSSWALNDSDMNQTAGLCQTQLNNLADAWGRNRAGVAWSRNPPPSSPSNWYVEIIDGGWHAARQGSSGLWEPYAHVAPFGNYTSLSSVISHEIQEMFINPGVDSYGGSNNWFMDDFANSGYSWMLECCDAVNSTYSPPGNPTASTGDSLVLQAAVLPAFFKRAAAGPYYIGGTFGPDSPFNVTGDQITLNSNGTTQHLGAGHY